MEDQIVLTIEDQDITFEKKSIASARLSLDFLRRKKENE